VDWALWLYVMELAARRTGKVLLLYVTIGAGMEEMHQIVGALSSLLHWGHFLVYLHGEVYVCPHVVW
jgi:hypothetical protein